jgi:hypothetical protein
LIASRTLECLIVIILISVLIESTENYKIPVILCYLGINDNPVGLKVQLYNILEMKHSGIFLLLNNLDIWKKLE